MRNPVVQDLIDKLRKAKVEYQHTDFKPTLPYIDLIVQYFERANAARDEGKPLVAHTVMCPLEIFYAMDLVPFFVEFYALYHTFLGDMSSYLERAAQLGLPPEVCSAHRLTDAMTVERAYPKPDVFVFSSQACDNTPKSGEGMAELYDNCPPYFLDRPYTYTGRTLNYYVQEYQELICFLEEQTGRKMDYDRLKEVVRKSYRATELSMEINELRKAVPEPLPCEGIFALTAVNWMMAGTDEAVELLTLMRDELRRRVDHGIGAIPNERFRLLFPFVLPFWDMPLMDWMQQEHGAVIVMDLLNSWSEGGKWFRDPDNPIENLARKTFLHPAACQLHGPMEVLIEGMVQNAIDYKADGAVFFSHIGCRQACGCIRSMKDELHERLDLPIAIIDCDIIDKSFATQEEVREKMDGFFERLEEQKGLLVE